MTINDIKIYTHPILVLTCFIKFITEETRDFISYLFKKHRLISIILLLTSIIISISSQFNGSHQLLIQYLIWYITWFFLGVSSSIAVGSGFHTFILFLGPYIAEVTLAAYQCHNIELLTRNPESFRLIECIIDDKNHQKLTTVWNIFQKVKWESFIWGAGTAIGELPPYFIARAVAETTELMNAKVTTTKEKILYYTFKMIQKLGFFGIFLFASIPNPLFDLAGITCGHFKIPFTTFFGATFLGKACVKATIQSLLVILVFSHDTLSTLLLFIQSNTPSSFDRFIQHIIQNQTSIFKDSELNQQNTIYGTVWNYLLTFMIIYYVLNSIESLAITYLKKKDSKRNTYVNQT